ncbi:TRAP transporter small permease [Billgrantia endophytica]|uniref:TRAP transporter small permease protein n=1 Tax=Billgrantia endophytica TaxID=2033802 RepID=A0A2N7TX40_9GAMM|nr:TRAP transporter small permease [Halomonas endophytica]PMR72741.1 TRAP transporter small permease [Halomonas endophytica]
MHIFGKLIDKLTYSLFLIGVMGGIGMTLLVFVSTVLRYVIGRPIYFSNELAGLLFLSLTFLTIPHVLNIGRHIRIDLAVNSLRPPMKRVTGLFSSFVLIAFSLIFIYESWDFMRFSLMIDARSDISGILLWPWMILMPLSFTLCILVQIRHGLRSPELSKSNTVPAEVTS